MSCKVVNMGELVHGYDLTSCLLSIAQLLRKDAAQRIKYQNRFCRELSRDVHLVVVTSTQINHDVLITVVEC